MTEIKSAGEAELAAIMAKGRASPGRRHRKACICSAQTLYDVRRRRSAAGKRQRRHQVRLQLRRARHRAPGRIPGKIHRPQSLPHRLRRTGQRRFGHQQQKVFYRFPHRSIRKRSTDLCPRPGPARQKSTAQIPGRDTGRHPGLVPLRGSLPAKTRLPALLRHGRRTGRTVQTSPTRK